LFKAGALTSNAHALNHVNARADAGDELALKALVIIVRGNMEAKK
jgi:hypothetical protein